MNFGKALEEVKQGRGMRLPQWKEDVVVRMWSPVLHLDIEEISEKVHNAWWEEKKNQGVTNHPDMIPYKDLAENIKDYDRQTVHAVMSCLTNMTAPYLYVESRFERVPWKETMIELFSEDWQVVE